MGSDVNNWLGRNVWSYFILLFIIILIICLIPLSVFSEVPPEYKKIISSYKVSNNSFTLVIKNLTNKSEPLITHNEKKFFNPASLAKIVSTFIALEVLGPQFSWQSDFYHNGTIMATH